MGVSGPVLHLFDILVPGWRLKRLRLDLDGPLRRCNYMQNEE